MASVIQVAEIKAIARLVCGSKIPSVTKKPTKANIPYSRPRNKCATAAGRCCRWVKTARMVT